ncbi:MAG TPA: MlaD family protein [Candidatus Binataceae bacterium]|nr:MlaD family protein [Candidatus Binataceae bacterium]
MAEQSSHSLRVGIVMIVGMAILAAAIFSIGGGLRWLAGSEELTTHFQRVNGLQVGAPVYLSGVNIGSVASIQFPPDRRANYVVVRMRIEANAVARVRMDSVAKIESLGLLGDKFLLLTAGSANAPSVEPEALVHSQDPVNYAALLQARGTGDLVANVLAISNAMRQLLDTVNQGNGILAELIRGPANPREKTLTLASIRDTVDTLQQLSAKLDLAVDRINNGEGVLGAILSPRNNGRRMVADVTDAAASMRTAAANFQQSSTEMHDLVERMDHARGLLPQLMQDQEYASRVMRNLDRSSNDLRDVLDKIDSRQGTLGLLVNDPSLYNKTTNLVSASGWGFSLFRGAYSLTHPFGTTASPSYAPVLAAPGSDTPAYSPADGAVPPAGTAPPATGAAGPAPASAPPSN